MKHIRDLELEDLDMVSLPDDIKRDMMKWFIMEEERLTSLYDVNWIWISFHNELSESFIEKHMDVLVMHYISRYQTLSESFIERHMDVLHMDYVCICQTLSESFIERHVDVLDICTILWNQDISLSLRQRLEHLINT